MKKINSIPAKTNTEEQTAQLSRSFLAPFPLLNSRGEHIHPSRHAGLCDVGLENLETSSSLCIGAHVYFSSLALSFGTIDPASFVLELDMEKGHFTILWSCSGFSTLQYLSHCVILTSLYHLNCSSMCNTDITATPDCSVQSSRSWCLTTSAKFSAVYVVLAGDILDDKNL